MGLGLGLRLGLALGLAMTVGYALPTLRHSYGGRDWMAWMTSPYFCGTPTPVFGTTYSHSRSGIYCVTYWLCS